eukprot:64374_1
MSAPRRALVIGGGVSGLSVAHFLRSLHPHSSMGITVAEQSNRLGGNVYTHRNDHENQFLFENGPRSFISRGGVRTLDLIEELGLAQKVIVANSDAGRRFIYTNGSMRRVSAMNLIRLSGGGILYNAWREYFRRTEKFDDESVFDFIYRRFGKGIAACLEPLIIGIFAGDYTRLSMKSCLPPIWNMAPEKGSLLKAYRKYKSEQKREPAPSHSPWMQDMMKQSQYSFEGGLRTFVEGLESHLIRNKVDIQRGTPIEGLRFRSKGDKIGAKIGGKWEEFDNVISTVGSDKLAQIMSTKDSEGAAQAAVINQLSEELLGIHLAPVYTVSIGYKENVLPEEYRGFGVLVPSKEKSDVLGITFDSCTFPQLSSSDDTRLTVMMGGSVRIDIGKWSPEQVEKSAREAVKTMLKIDREPDYCKVARQAIPQYYVGHSIGVEKIEKLANFLDPKFTVSGWSFHGISVNMCIENAHRMVHEKFDS